VSQSTAQVLIAAVFCLGFIAFTYRLARSGHLSFRYTMGWLGLFAIGIVAMIALPVTNKVSEWLRLTPAALLALSGLFILLVICIQLSISISGMQNQIRRLSEEVAKLRLEDNDAIRGHAD
jgi:hypothetical protein